MVERIPGMPANPAGCTDWVGDLLKNEEQRTPHDDMYTQNDHQIALESSAHIVFPAVQPGGN
jgi:hypothetical protein